MNIFYLKLIKSNSFVQFLYCLYKKMKFIKKFSYGNEFRKYVCKLPFEYAEITKNGEISACCYLPRNFGNAYNLPFKKAWNSYFARQVRRSILDGSYRYCDKTRCRSMQNLNANLIKKNELKDVRLKNIIRKSIIDLDSDVKTLSLAIDYTCNLKCPSCREGMRVMANDEAHKQLVNFNSIMQEIGPKLELIHIAGDGDPFASKVYHDILFHTNWEQYPNLKIGIQTNGILLTEKTWEGLPSIVKSRIVYIGVSIDGATPATYEKLRLGGKFDRLLSNLEYISKIRDKEPTHFLLNLNMIVQADNYKEMIQLVELGNRIGVDNIGFTYMYNWGTFSQSEYEKKAIILQNHSEHSNLLTILKDPIFNNPSVDMGNLAYLIKN